jgi:CHAD domain-containing protein
MPAVWHSHFWMCSGHRVFAPHSLYLPGHLTLCEENFMSLDPDQIQKSVNKLRKLVKKAPKRPTPDQVHDLRTQARRFEATTEALHLDSKRNERRALRTLARIRKRAGKVRDMDVFTGRSSNLRVDDDQDCLVQLLEHLGSARYQHARKLSLEMRESGPALRKRLKRTAARFEKLISINRKNDKKNGGRKSSNGRTKADAEVAALALKLASELENPPALNKNNLHPYRLKVKELRNVLALAGNPGNQAFIDILGEVKDAIGEWHDWEELIAIADDLLDHGPACKLLQELKTISARKYEHALSLTHKMRRDFLRSARFGKHAPPRPILQATAAIAS